MRLVIQRVARAQVAVAGEFVASIAHGLMVLAGVTHGDTEVDSDLLAEKVAGLRIFADESGSMNLSVDDSGGEILVVSQFTLYADSRRGRRPSFTDAAAPSEAEALIDRFAERLRGGALVVRQGRFGAYMDVDLVNTGPVTIILETREGRFL
ncbi:D-aminoacyl-tRNA deacylase [soil metagenome]